MEGGEGRRKEGKGGKGGDDLNASPFETPGGAGRGAPGLLSLLKRKTSRAFFVVVSRGSRRAWREDEGVARGEEKAAALASASASWQGERAAELCLHGRRIRPRFALASNHGEGLRRVVLRK